MKKYGIIVLYNKEVRESLTYNCLKNCQDIDIIVCDNSTRVFRGNAENVENDGYVYINMNGNCGLSKAYNKALDYIQKTNSDMEGFLMLFDDDTYIPKSYFRDMMEAVRNEKSDIFLPIVKDEIGLLSPSVMKKYYCHRAKGNIADIKQEEICGINSGMGIKLAVFSDYRYNEKIFLDYVDHNFLRDMRKRNKKVVVVDTEIKQTFSSNTDSKEKARIRYRIFKKDINIFYEHGLGNRLFYHYVIFRRKLQLTRKYRDIKILFSW